MVERDIKTATATAVINRKQQMHEILFGIPKNWQHSFPQNITVHTHKTTNNTRKKTGLILL